MKKDKKKKEEIAEDYCFICKDGGLLLVCDYKNCLKAYHTSCIGKDDTFLETEKRWTCGWHTCSNCHKSSTFQCFCCPNSFCQACINGADFVQVENKSRGFCGFCLKLTTMIEEHGDVDSDGEKVDFNDTSTYEFLFKDYWEIVKEKEGLTLTDLHAAAALLKSGKNYKTESDLDNLPEEDLISEDDYLEDKYDEGIVVFDDIKGKCHKTKTPLKRSRSKKKTFIGWGSKELLQFLASVGKNTAQPLTQLDACEIVKDYIHEHNLFHPDKKKKVVSDGNLYSLFRKRSLKLHKIYTLLESHFAENEDSNDESSFSSEDGGDLIEDSETFEHKVVGCFVRVKSDPKDFFYSPEKPYQLGQVIGIKKIAMAYKLGDSSIDIVLKISNMFKDIQITMLSDDDIEEEECEDLRRLVKKVFSKGLPLDLLRTPAERLRLLKKIPNVIADTEEETVATSGVVKLQKDTKGEGAACVTTQTKEAKDVNVADVPSPIEKLERGADVVVESLIQEPADIELKFGEIDETSGPKKIDKAKEYDPMVLRSLKDQVINIDEDEESAPNVLQNDEASTEETCEVWHYIDPSGNEQGPFSLASLRYWKEEGFFKDDFKVWRSGEPRESAILLTNVLHLTSSS
ncbi:hypothetical protein J5N97_001406 [Dioscorea zingiberensis]|uniref:Uncharacterized protein n=1 Tax=Dioscorea zingiberensis TaxID=325984 RepID=A0A9D5BUD5_9LILI|nr:hypothetical protein J5N97_001406 [Dioscorea zingiberensis]